MVAKRRTAPTARRVGIYVRISKDRANEVSTDVQRKACTAYASERGWQVVEVFEDVGRSAFKANVRRPEFERMVEHVEAGLIDTVIAYKLDRLARSVRDFANLAATLDDNRAEFVSVTESFDTTTPMGRAMVSIASVFAELESAVKSERIGDAMAHLRAQGAATHGPRPFGLSADRKQLDPTEAKLIRDAAKRVMAGASLREIVAGWNAEAVPTSRGGSWNRRGLAHVLTNPTTAGLREIDGSLVPGTMPAVLDRATWDSVRAILRDPDRTTGGTNDVVHLLTGIVTCERCKTPMATKGHKAGFRYACAPRKGHEDACQGVSIDGSKLDALIGDAIAFRIDTKDVRNALRKPRNRQDDLAAIDDDLEALAADFGAGLLSRREWEAARAGLEARRVEAADERAGRRVDAYTKKLADAADIGKAWKRLDVNAQRSVMRTLIESVSVAAAVPGRQFDSGRVDVTWRA
jgi:DNA invertase Pin-like site-specific DNA recombinase